MVPFFRNDMEKLVSRYQNYNELNENDIKSNLNVNTTLLHHNLLIYFFF